jgi:hypothetical protein
MPTCRFLEGLPHDGRHGNTAFHSNDTHLLKKLSG